MSSSFVTSWTVAHQALLSMGFPRQEYWSGLPFPFPVDIPNPVKVLLLRWQAYLLLCHLESLDLKMTKLETLTDFASTLTTIALFYDTGGLFVSLLPFWQDESVKLASCICRFPVYRFN